MNREGRGRGHVDLGGGYFRVSKDGADLDVTRHLAQATPPVKTAARAPLGANHANGIAAAVGFPHPPHHAAPETIAGRAQGAARTPAPRQVSSRTPRRCR